MSQPITGSELIVNGRGAVYHLDMRPEELASTVITVGDPGRVPVVSKYFDRILHQSAHREFVWHTGTIGSKKMTVLSTGIGPDNIDIALTELDALANIDFQTREIKPALTRLNIIRMGTCGGLQPDIPTDGLVASSHGIGLDNLLLYYPLEQSAEEKELLHAFIKHTGIGNRDIHPYFAAGDPEWLNTFINAGYKYGITATCPGFYGPQGRTLRQPVAFPDLPEKMTSFSFKDLRITNFEMETAAIFGLGKLFGHRCMAVNTVVANRTTGEFSKDSGKAIENMIEKSLNLLVD